jgi:ATPase subunit of ABC transporter with duplicated ATPase domains
MLAVSGLSKAFGGRTLFDEVSFQLTPGSRYGLVGANGSGKSTLLRILAGDEPSSGGTIALPSRVRMGVLRQDHSLDDSRLILDLAMSGDQEAYAALRERERIIDHGEGDPLRLAELEDTIRTLDGRTLEARASAVLEGLGIPRTSHPHKLATLSGGFKLRVLLAQVLLSGPDLVLLDEPTNHLDILSIRWLEKFLAAYRGAALVISHDQRFLDNVVTHVLDVDYETVTEYPGNYSAFVVEKAAVRERKESEIARQEKIIAEKRAFVERFGAKATKAKQAQSRLKQIEKIEVEELADSSRRTPLFKFAPERASGRDVVSIDSVSKAYGPKQVLKNVSLTVRRGERVGVIGSNGLGKSTLLKIIMGAIAADAGKVDLGHAVVPGYFAQEHRELLHGASTPLDYVWAVCPNEGTTYVRGQLGRVLFTGADVDKPVSSLSGGECARLLFARIAVEKPNLLILDEPTNHLDIESIGALIEALATFDGTVIFVSHDRHFVSSLATRILELTPDGPRDFPGTFGEYLERCGDDHLDADAVVLKAKAERVATSAPPTGAKSWEEQKKRRNRIAALPAQRDALLAAIEKAEAARAAIAERYDEPNFYERTGQEELGRLVKEDDALAASIERNMTAWEAVEQEIAAAAAEASGA